MNKAVSLLVSAGLGAGLMYLLDPDRGRRRRSVLRDRSLHAARRTGAAIDLTRRDLVNRSRGLGADLRRRLREDHADERVLTERVRAGLGRLVSHPHSIRVHSEQGTIVLGGPVIAGEVGPLLRGVRAIRGVREVRDELEVHDSPAHVPGLQGALTRAGRGRFELMQANWSPTARLLVGTAGAAAALYGTSRRSPAAATAGLAGALALLRAVTNLELRRLFGIGAGRRAVDIQKSIHIEAPVERVYQMFTHYENFPRLMSQVREVERLDARRSRWKLAAPGGVRLEWIAELVSEVPNELLAWRTDDGASVEHAGIVRFMRLDDGSTNLDVKLTYNPVAGAAGHALLALLGSDPKHRLDADLLRLKSFIETGTPARDAARQPGGTEPAVH